MTNNCSGYGNILLKARSICKRTLELQFIRLRSALDLCWWQLHKRKCMPYLSTINRFILTSWIQEQDLVFYNENLKLKRSYWKYLRSSAVNLLSNSVWVSERNRFQNILCVLALFKSFKTLILQMLIWS